MVPPKCQWVSFEGHAGLIHGFAARDLAADVDVDGAPSRVALDE